MTMPAPIASTWLVLTWTAYLCTGRLELLGGVIKVPVASFPELSKPALAAIGVCRAQAAFKLFDPGRREPAQEAFRKMSPAANADLQECRGADDCRSIVRWTTTLTFDDVRRGP